MITQSYRQTYQDKRPTELNCSVDPVGSPGISRQRIHVAHRLLYTENVHGSPIFSTQRMNVAHPASLDREWTFLVAAAPGTVSELDHVLGHEASLNRSRKYQNHLLELFRSQWSARTPAAEEHMNCTAHRNYTVCFGIITVSLEDSKETLRKFQSQLGVENPYTRIYG